MGSVWAPEEPWEQEGKVATLLGTSEKIPLSLLSFVAAIESDILFSRGLSWASSKTFGREREKEREREREKERERERKRGRERERERERYFCFLAQKLPLSNCHVDTHAAKQMPHSQ